jgi:hypothetical protein
MDMLEKRRREVEYICRERGVPDHWFEVGWFRKMLDILTKLFSGPGCTEEFVNTVNKFLFTVGRLDETENGITTEVNIQRIFEFAEKNPRLRSGLLAEPSLPDYARKELERRQGEPK